MRLLYTIICVILLAFGSSNVLAQSVVVQKSNEQEVIAGKIFFVHHVKKGETLYSISKAYFVPSSIIIECNNKENISLAIGEILRIPRNFVNDTRYIYHCLKQGETLYSIKQKTGINVDAILRHNTGIKDVNDIAVGTYIKIPKDSIVNRQYAINMINKKNEIETSVDRLHDISVEEAKVTTEPLKDILEETTILNEDSEVLLSDTIINKNINIAVFLPFYLTENDFINREPDDHSENHMVNNMEVLDDKEAKDSIVYKKIYKKSENFIKFYQGFLMACDSMKNEGFNITINTFDTEKNKDTVRHIVDSLDFAKFDFVVGPPYSSTFHIAAEKALASRTPIISPLSDNTKMTELNPYVFQLNTSEKTIVKSTADYIYNNFKNSNIVVVYPKGYQNTPEAKLVTSLEDNLYNCNKFINYTDIHYTKISFSKYNFFGIKQVLKRGVENIVIVPSKNKSDIYNIIPTVNALTDNYKISLIALPSWQRYKSLDPSTFFNLNTRVLSPYHVDYKDEKVIQFVDNFRKQFDSEPSDFSFRAYDLATYFIKSAAKGNLKHVVYKNKQANQLQSCFKFTIDKDMLGKENKGLHLIHYKRDYTVEKKSINQ